MAKKFELQFEERYTYRYSKIYYQRHKEGFLKRFSNFLEQHMIKKALKLANFPKVVLDLPCGAGRFIETMMKNGAEKIIAADKSDGMLQVIKDVFPSTILNKIDLLQTSVTETNLPDKSVDSTFCIRLIHHIHDKDYREAIYKELRRISRETVCITYWVGGNLQSYREMLKAKRKKMAPRCHDKEKLADELTSAGFNIIGTVDMLKPFSYWRAYVLKV